ncbi:MAG: glycosyl transferase family 2 [Bacteroidetes bacterium HGW-Bacteroidetes-17]|jgi:glycosyltransferase involved in cell wall biosynthesis|nr:MAG: glycosyl transferase family 2 [Bacteroidetes bacterium HGW-Bacteroidetes-17]
MEMPIPQFSIPFILFAIYALAFIDQMIYYWFIFSKLAFYRPTEQSKELLPVSVVICARNEDYLLKTLLPKILEQDYPSFEIVVVNDSSTDDTLEYLEDLKRIHPNISIVNIAQNLNFFSGKKFPLSLGIKSAKNELLVLTDPDCEPTSNQWLKNMALAFTPSTEIVLGYGPIKPDKGLFNTIVRYDTMQRAIQYLSYTLIGKTFMGVGRNLAYKKSLFYKSKGFISHYKIQSGDDDIFINRVATSKNTSISIRPESFMYTAFVPYFRLWFLRKQQQLNTVKYFRSGTRFLLGKYELSKLAIYALFATLLILEYNIVIVLGLFGLRLLTQMIIIKKSMIVLSERKLLLVSPLLELLMIFIHITVRISNVFIKQNKWK